MEWTIDNIKEKTLALYNANKDKAFSFHLRTFGHRVLYSNFIICLDYVAFESREKRDILRNLLNGVNFEEEYKTFRTEFKTYSEGKTVTGEMLKKLNK